MTYPIATPVDESALITNNSPWDGVIFIAATASSAQFEAITQAITHYAAIDQRVGKEAVLIPADKLAGGRLLFSPTGPLERYYDDVRRFADAAHKAAAIAKQAGMQKPLLLVETPSDAHAKQTYANAIEVAYLGFCQGLWQPLEARESGSEIQLEPITELGIVSSSVDAEFVNALEAGKRLARDLCGTNPERMAPPLFADYCVDAFAGSGLAVEVISDQAQLQSEYPLLSAVARAAVAVERHHARVVTITYIPEGEVSKSLYLAGKGVTYDTGGADLKTGGFMAGMSRDKGGAAAVAGFMKTVAMLKPKGIKVVAELGLVRNSIGSDAFVADEIITSRAGVRVRIGNTDAEGRLVLSDVLTHLTELAEHDVAPEFFSVATLTGHAARAVGPYTALVENGVARANGDAQALVNAGDAWGDAAEISRSRREDYDFIAPRTSADDVLSSNNAASAVTARGHQFPMAFLNLSSGLSKTDYAFTHIDIAGSGVEQGDWQHGKPTAAPVVMLAARYLAQ